MNATLSTFSYNTDSLSYDIDIENTEESMQSIIYLHVNSFYRQ